MLKSEIMDQEVYPKIRGLGSDIENHYKYWIYLQMNINLTKSPLLNRIDLIGKHMIKFRTGSHNLKTETGKCRRTPVPTACAQIVKSFGIIFMRSTPVN